MAICDIYDTDCKYNSDYHDSSSSSSSYYDYDYGNSLSRNNAGLNGQDYSSTFYNEFDDGHFCRYKDIAFASSLGAFTILCAILFLLQGLRLWSNKKRGIPILQFKSSRGLAEIAVMVSTLFTVLQLILGWAEFGLISTACKKREEGMQLFFLEDSTREGRLKYAETRAPLQTLVKTLPAVLAFTFLCFWFARLSNSLQFTVFRLGFSKFARVCLYIQWFICTLGIVVTGFTIPAIFSYIDLIHYDNSSGFYNYEWDILTILLLIHLVADVIFLILSMILTSATSRHVKRLNQNHKARSLWTLNIISIIPAFFCLVTIKITFLLLVGLIMYCTFTWYFALVLAYLPGYRFWRKTWRDAGFDDDLASTQADEEAGTATRQPEMAQTTPAVAPVLEGDRISVESEDKVQPQQPGGESSTAARDA